VTRAGHGGVTNGDGYAAPPMGRGARATRRWKNDRIRDKKARDRRKSEAARAAAVQRKGGAGSGTA
jgi:hypothetical protein